MCGPIDSSGVDNVRDMEGSSNPPDAPAPSATKGTDLLKYGVAGLQGIGMMTAASGSARASTAARAGFLAQANVEAKKAEVDRWRAGDAEFRGQQQAFAQGLKAGATEGSQRAAFAARGVAMDEGSPMAILADTSFMAHQDFTTILDNASKEAYVLRATAENEDRNAELLRYRAGMESPTRAAATSLLTSAGTVAPSWYKMYKGYDLSKD